MLGLNCLLRTPGIVRDLTNLMTVEGYTLLFNGKPAKLSTVYATLRENGIEVDIQTAAEIYENIFDLTDPAFSSQAEVDAARGAAYQDIIDKRVAAMRRNEIGRDNPAVAVARHLARLVQKDLKANPSVQKLMQERLEKAAGRILQQKGVVAAQRSMDAILKEVLLLEQNNPYYNMGAMNNAQTLFTEFQKEIDELAQEMASNNSMGAAVLQQHAQLLQQAGYDLLLSGGEIRDVLNQTMKEAGLTRLMKVAGQDKMVIDWRAVMARGFDFRGTMSDVLTQKGFSQSEVARVVPFFEREFARLKQSKIAAAAQQAGADQNFVDRIARLANLGAFQQTQKQAIYDALKVAELTQGQLHSLEQMARSYSQMMQMDLADLSPTFFRTAERHVRNLVERAQEGQSKKLAFVRGWQLYAQFSASAILMNMGNLFENLTSGFAEVFNTAVQNPRLLLEAGRTWATVFSDVALGGVRQGVEKSNIWSDSVNLEDRTSRENGSKLTFGQVASTAQRILLSATDASAKAFLWKVMEVNALTRALQAQGLTRSEATAVVNEAYFGNRAQLEATAKHMVTALQAGGINVREAKWERIASELAAANLLTDGQFMKDTLLRLEAAGKLAAGKKDLVHVDHDLIRVLRAAADGAAARGLGHSQDLAIGGLFDRMIGAQVDAVDQARSSGNLSKLAAAETGRLAVGSLFRFRSGALKWAMLNFEKTSGLALLSTLIYDIGVKRKHDLLRPSRIKERLQRLEALRGQESYEKELTALERDLEGALAVRQRLGREIIQPALSFALFQAAAPVLAELLSDVCSDNTPECHALKMEAIKEAGWDNVLSKAAPVAVLAYLNGLVEKKSTAKDFFNYEVRDGAPQSPLSSYLSTASPLWKNEDGEWTGNSEMANRLKEFVVQNIGQDPIYGPLTKLTDAKEEKTGAILGSVVGNATNLLGATKTFDTNDRFFNTMSGTPNTKSREEYEQKKVNGFWEGWLRSNMSSSLFEAYVKGDNE